MRAAIFRGGDIVVDTMPEPVPGPGQVLVKTLACGICGSDLHAAKHAHRMVAVSQAHSRPGADGSVARRRVRPRILLRGARLRPEDRAHAEARHAGLRHAADARSPTGPRAWAIPTTYVGGYAERMLLSAPLMLEVPNGLPTEHAALTEPLAVGVHAVEKGALTGDEAPLVVGCGPVGLAVIAALRLKGIRPIVAADFSPKRRELAAKMGADIVVDPATEIALCQARGRQARRDLRVRRRARPDPAGVREGAARCPRRSWPASAWSPTRSSRCSPS